MTIKAVIKRPSVIIANTAAITSTQSSPAISLKSGIGGVSQNYVHNLVDVVENNPANGATLVYNAELDKYEVKIPEIVGQVALDGGSF